MANMHIWTGCRAERDSNNWWMGTVAIDCSTDVNQSVSVSGTNIYLDSAYHFIETWRGATINLSNVIAWMDGSMAGSTATEGIFVATRGNIVERNVQINGMVARFRGRIKYIMSDAISFRNLKMILEDGEDFTTYQDARKYPISSWLADKEFLFNDYGEAGTYIETARAVLYPSTCLVFELNTNSDTVTFELSADNNGNLKVFKAPSVGTSKFYYLYDKSNYIVYIYRYRYGSDAIRTNIRVKSATLSSGLLNYSSIRVFNRNVLSDDSTLTEITAKKTNDGTIIIDNVNNFTNTINMMERGRTYNIYMTEPVVKLITGNRLNAIGKGFCSYLLSGTIDFFIGIGGDMYLIRTNESGVPSRIRQMTATSLI